MVLKTKNKQIEKVLLKCGKGGSVTSLGASVSLYIKMKELNQVPSKDPVNELCL